ncbi:MAG: tryptophan-rich sensory protein [Parvularculaceae bacterium]|nr:tryptophan-rich sensory protein [Parvularculaceae bacterium]
MTSHRTLPYAVSIGLAVFAAFAGGALTDVGTWYQALNKPSWNPPDWLFGPAWTLIYIALVIAGVRGWHAVHATTGKAIFATLVILNLVLNISWSWLFFTVKRPDFALVEVVFLWLSILAIVVFIAAKDRPAMLLTLPYLFWVGFAGYLNLVIVQLNPSFGLC